MFRSHIITQSLTFVQRKAIRVVGDDESQVAVFISMHSFTYCSAFLSTHPRLSQRAVKFQVPVHSCPSSLVSLLVLFLESLFVLVPVRAPIVARGRHAPLRVWQKTCALLRWYRTKALYCRRLEPYIPPQHNSFPAQPRLVTCEGWAPRGGLRLAQVIVELYHSLAIQRPSLSHRQWG